MRRDHLAWRALALLLLGVAPLTAAQEAGDLDLRLFDYWSTQLASIDGGPGGQIPLLFNGSSSIDVEPQQSLQFRGEGTLEFTVAAGWNGALGYSPTIVAVRDEQATLYSVHLAEDGSGLILWNGDAGGLLEFPFFRGQLHQVAVVTQSQETNVYVDGVAIGGLAMGYGSGRNLGLHVGSSDGANEPFVGVIGYLRWWNRALTAGQIRDMAPVYGPPAENDPLYPALVAFSDFTRQHARIRLIQ